MEQYFTSIDIWKELLASEFNRGYLTGVLLVLAVVILLLVLRLTLGFLFRNRRAKVITVPAPDGDVQISQDAVESVIDGMLTEFPEVMLDSLKIYHRGRKYSLQIKCRFESGKRSFPDVIGKLKAMIFSGLNEQFGITGLRTISILLTALEGDAVRKKADPAIPADSAVPPVLPGNPGL